jgi:hypothetical protein
MSSVVKVCHCGKTYKSEGFFKKHVESCLKPKQANDNVQPAATQPAATQPAATQPAATQPDTPAPKNTEEKPEELHLLEHILRNARDATVEEAPRPDSFIRDMREPHRGLDENILHAADHLAPQRDDCMPDFKPYIPDPNEDKDRKIKKLEEMVMTLLLTYSGARMINEQLVMENDYFRSVYGIPKITFYRETPPPPNANGRK